jgi:HK97 family phage prohead protease
MDQPNIKRITFDTPQGDQRFSIIKSDTGRATLKGYCIVWNVLSGDRGGFVVRFLPNSATPALLTFALSDHDYQRLLARNDDGSLRILPADSYGIPCEIDVPDTTIGRDAEWLVANQKIRGMSPSVVPDSVESFETIENGINVVNYSKFVFDEVSITPIPAFDQTSIEVKTENIADTKLEDNEKELREHFAKLTQYKLDYYSFDLSKSQPKGEIRNMTR